VLWWANGAALSCSVWQLLMSSCNRVRRPLVPHAHGSQVVTLPSTARCELREQEEEDVSCAGAGLRSRRREPCLFQLFGASGHQKLLRTAKRSAFQSAFIKFVWLKTIQNQHKHIIG
jgi:hypothetical protein